MIRRSWLTAMSAVSAASAVSAMAAWPKPADAQEVRRGRPLAFPRDHGAHPETGIEWWYLTAWLGSVQAPRYGIQLTFFRRRTALADGEASRFAARQLLFAHAALTDLQARRHRHAMRIARWDGSSAGPWARCARATTDVAVHRWRLQREGTNLVGSIDGEFALELRADASAPPLLQGDAGFSRKGPRDDQASLYYSQPQLPLAATLVLDGRRTQAEGRAWLDHEWSDTLMPADAVGWDWIGMNLVDGAALTAFRLRRADGSVVWAGGSWRRADGTLRIFASDEVRFEPLRHWSSAAARYPVQWRVVTPAGEHRVNALLDAQELDQRHSTGVLYWEGLSELSDAAGRRIGLGYLEMTGYGAALKLL